MSGIDERRFKPPYSCCALHWHTLHPEDENSDYGDYDCDGGDGDNGGDDDGGDGGDPGSDKATCTAAMPPSRPVPVP